MTENSFSQRDKVVLSQASVSLLVVVTLFMLPTLSGCGASSAPDPRCRVTAQGDHRIQLLKSINGSDLWQDYLDHMQSSVDGSTSLVDFSLTMGRKRVKSYGGDYDPGTVTVKFQVTAAKHRTPLFSEDVDVALDPFMIGLFDKASSREEIQEIAFKATEGKIYPYLDRWINISAIRAMGRAGARGTEFVPALNDLIEDKWTSADMRAAAREAIQQIRG